MRVSQQTVSKLIKEIRRKYPDAVPKISPPKLVPYKPSMDSEVRQRISWSQTVQIAVARLDKRCPVCNAHRWPSQVFKVGSKRKSGIVRTEEEVGKGDFVVECDFAYCCWCGWSFSFEDE